MNSTSKIQWKYVFRCGCGILMTAVCVFLFFNFWIRFVRLHNTTGSLLGLGNLGMSVGLYMGILFLTFKGLGGYKLGVVRKMNLVASISLAIAVTDFLTVFVSMAVTGHFRFFFILLREYVGLAILEIPIICLLACILTDVYRKVFPPLSIIEYCGESENSLSFKMNTVYYKYHVSEVIHLEQNLDAPAEQEKLKSQIAMYDAVLINDLPAHQKNIIVKTCFDMGKRVYMVPKISDIIVKASDDINLVDTPLYLSRNIGMNFTQQLVKRFFDIVLSALALVVLSPLLLITAILIKHEDGGPVFFRQERVTKNGKRFMILKFRSMIVDAEKDGRARLAKENDDRITKVGKVIRATRIDELPQLINILKGEMSIVGPRPERWEIIQEYHTEIPEFDFRLKVKGGLTGYAQVYGKYNTTALDKLKLDLMYVTNYSFLLDVQIIFETVKIIFQKESTEGISEERDNEMKEFVEGERKE